MAFYPSFLLAFTKSNIKLKVYEPTYRMGPVVSVVILILKKDSIYYSSNKYLNFTICETREDINRI